MQRQIQSDREYLGIGRDRLQRLKATVWESITTEPVASEPQSGKESGIPPDIYLRLRQALSDCDQFKSHSRLFDFFDANEPLKRWCDDLPEVDNRTERAERVIGFLVNEKRSDTQENVLLILLSLLKDQIDPIKPLHQTLSNLLQELALLLSGFQSKLNIAP